MHAKKRCNTCYHRWLYRTPYGKRQRLDVTRKWLYGISRKQFNELETKQKFRCAMCKEQKPLCVDHDHQTGVIRGLLCMRCNKGLGFLGDCVISLQRALRYLQKAVAS